MTKEEIISGLQFTIDMFLFNPNTGESREEYELNIMDKTTIYACRGAIKLLKQEPCEDCISRQAVIQHICEDKFCYKENCKGNIYKRCPDIAWVYDLPSVNPQERQGIGYHTEMEG